MRAPRRRRRAARDRYSRRRTSRAPNRRFPCKNAGQIRADEFCSIMRRRVRPSAWASSQGSASTASAGARGRTKCRKAQHHDNGVHHGTASEDGLSVPKQPLLNRDRSRSSGRNRLTADARMVFRAGRLRGLRYPEVCLTFSESITFTLAARSTRRTRKPASKARVMSGPRRPIADDVFARSGKRRPGRFSSQLACGGVQVLRAAERGQPKTETEGGTNSVYPDPKSPNSIAVVL